MIPVKVKSERLFSKPKRQVMQSFQGPNYEPPDETNSLNEILQKYPNIEQKPLMSSLSKIERDKIEVRAILYRGVMNRFVVTSNDQEKFCFMTTAQDN